MLYYLKYIENKEIKVINESSGISSLFGNIDTKDEAFFLVFTNGYGGENLSGIKEMESGFEVRARTVEGGCGVPLVTKAFQLHVCKEGQTTILHEEVVETTVGPCY